jgi:putative ABC transport system substrate-binding protein
MVFSPKSKACPGFGYGIENPKLAGIIALVFTFAMGGNVVEAQQEKKIPVVGTLHADSPSSVAKSFAAFREGLGKLGYVVDQNIVIEERYADGKRDRLAELAAELVRLNVDVIFAVGGGSVSAAKSATNTIPIVASAGDLVRDGSSRVSQNRAGTLQE